MALTAPQPGQFDGILTSRRVLRRILTQLGNALHWLPTFRDCRLLVTRLLHARRRLPNS